MAAANRSSLCLAVAVAVAVAVGSSPPLHHGRVADHVVACPTVYFLGSYTQHTQKTL